MKLPSFDCPRRLLSCVFVSLFATGCALKGDRAEGFGACPQGETCSDKTPKGLEFTTSSVRQEAYGLVNDVAIGGLMTVTANQRSGAAVPAFEALSSSPDRVDVVDVHGATFRVRGVSEGEALIRLLAAGSPELLDRARFQAHEVATLSLGFPAYWKFSFLPPETFPPLPLAALSSRPAPLALELSSADGRGLVDEAATFDPPGDAPEKAPWWYRTFTLPEGSTSLEVNATAGGRSTSVVMPVYEKADGVEAVLVTGFGVESVVTPLQGAVLSKKSSGVSFCFRPVAAGHELTNAEGTVQLGNEPPQLVGRGCRYLGSDPPVGTMLVQVELDDQKWAYELTVQ